MSNMYNGLPKQVPVASETRNGLMSAKDKKLLCKLSESVSDVLKKIGNIPTDKLARANNNIEVDDTSCGVVSLNGDIVTLNITMSADSKDLFTLPEEFTPRTSLMYLIPITKGGKVVTGQLHIFTNGLVTCTCSSYKGIIINTSVSYVK